MAESSQTFWLYILYVWRQENQPYPQSSFPTKKLQMQFERNDISLVPTYFQLLMFSITAGCIVCWHDYRPSSLCNSFYIWSRHCIWRWGSAFSSYSTIIPDGSLKEKKSLMLETFMTVLFNSTDMTECYLLFQLYYIWVSS
jgi:hypothetical protein